MEEIGLSGDEVGAYGHEETLDRRNIQALRLDDEGRENIHSAEPME